MTVVISVGCSLLANFMDLLVVLASQQPTQPTQPTEIYSSHISPKISILGKVRLS